MNHLQTESTVDDIQLVQFHGSIDWWRRVEGGREDKIAQNHIEVYNIQNSL